MQPLKKFLIFCLALVLLHRFCQLQTDGFSRARIESDLTYHPEWQTECPETIGSILNQPFYYLECGAQTFAFASADDQYVIKFYRHHRAGHIFSFLAPLLPSPLKHRLEQTIAKRQNKRLKDFSSYKLAYDLLPNETGLICIHLNKTHTLNQSLKFYDKIGVLHTIDLDKMEFLLQKKATPFYSTLEQWIGEGSFEKAENGLSELIALLQSRCQKGLFDKDPDFKTNFGFIGTHPIQFDVGRFKNDPSLIDPDELTRITAELHQWLEEKAPRLAGHLEQELRKSS